MAAHGDREDKDWRTDHENYKEHTEDERKGYVIGYWRGALEYGNALDEHGPAHAAGIWKHFLRHWETLKRWRFNGDGRVPPTLPDYTPDPN